MAKIKAKDDNEDDKKSKKTDKIDRPKDLGALMKSLNKYHGDGTIMQGRAGIVETYAIPTKVPTIDVAFGVGGLPEGRIVEMYGMESSGKTTTCIQFIASCQQHFFPHKGRKGVCAFVDAEHAFDPKWAADCGVDVDALLFSQPNSGEEAFDIVDKICDSGLVDLVVIDSVANLVPKVELDGEIGDFNIGAQARLMSKGLRMISGKTHKSKTTVIFINQIRQKIGVMFGCLHGETLVNFVDGRRLSIAEVVAGRIGGDVWSYDENTKGFVARPITGWHNNGEVESAADYLSVAIKGPGAKNSRMNVVVTPDHRVMTPDGWSEARSLVVGDRLLTKQESFVFSGGKVNGTLGQFLTGVLSGDSHVAHTPGRLAASLLIRDNIDPGYMRWKAARLVPFVRFARRDCPSGERYESDCYSELLQLKSEYPKRDPMILLNHFSWLGFAVWVMDDAVYERGRYHLSIKRFAGNFDKIEQISRTLDDLGLYHYASRGGSITFDKAVSDHIAEHIAGIVPPCMQHKLPVNRRGYHSDFDLKRSEQWRDAYATVVGVREASTKQMKNRGKFDITVAGTECYSAGGSDNGVIVHNSPDTTPGGLALKFYASLRIQINKGSPIKDGKETVGFATNLSVKKNKCAPPFTTAEYGIKFGDPCSGVDMIESMLKVAGDMNLLDKSSSYFIFDGVKVNGYDAASRYVREHPEVQEGLMTKIYGNLRDRAGHLTVTASDGDDEDDTLNDDILDQVTDGD